MPSPTFPTGSVSGGSNGTRTFPVRDDPRTGRVDDASAADEPAADERTTRREPQSPREELAHLRRENAELRRALRETREQRQEVIDRYERLLDGRDPDGESVAEPALGFDAAPPVRAPESPQRPFAERVAAELDARWTAVRRRYRRWVDESSL